MDTSNLSVRPYLLRKAVCMHSFPVHSMAASATPIICSLPFPTGKRRWVRRLRILVRPIYCRATTRTPPLRRSITKRDRFATKTTLLNHSDAQEMLFFTSGSSYESYILGLVYAFFRPSQSLRSSPSLDSVALVSFPACRLTLIFFRRRDVNQQLFFWIAADRSLR